MKQVTVVLSVLAMATWGIGGGVWAAQEKLQAYKASELIGANVVNPKGEDLGDIQEIVLSPDDNRISYAVVSFGGWLGIGDKYFAVPWNALQYDRQEERFVMNVDRKQMEKAEGFSKDDWPDMADRKWASDIHAFYGQEPYWETTGAEMAGGAQTITGELLRVDGEFYVVKDSQGKEVRIHVDKDTNVQSEPKKGDHIKARVTQAGHAQSIDKASH